MKNINFKLVNTLLLLIIIFLVWIMRGLWLGVVSRICAIALPFVIGFVLAYVLNPLLKFLIKKGIPKKISLAIIFASILLFITIFLWILIPSVLPMMFNQTQALFVTINDFIKDISVKFDLNLMGLSKSIETIASNITGDLSKVVSQGFINFISSSLNFLANLLIALIATIYFMFDMDNIRDRFEKFLKKLKNKKTFKFFETLDDALHKYINAFCLFALIIFIEYTLVFYIIGHPYFLLLGILAGFGTFIPYFGGIILGIIAIITASVISPQLLILSIIVALIFPNIDGYFTAPKIYAKSNKVPALLSVFSVFAGGMVAGFVGVVIALPVTIIILTTLRFYDEEIDSGIEQLKKKIDD